MAWLAYVWDLGEIWCLCEIILSRGCPWWFYICSQLGFTSSFCLLLHVEVLGLAGFMYPSSGLLPWQEPGRQISRTEGSYPHQGASGASPSFDACTSWIFLGITWASPSLIFCPFFILSHHSPIPTLENFLHTKHNTILLATFSINIIVDQPFLVQVSTQKHTYKAYTTVATSPKVP
jgi:hypothetical protein